MGGMVGMGGKSGVGGMGWSHEMVQQVKALAPGLDGLSSISVTHIVGGRTNMFCELYMHSPACPCPHTYTQRINNNYNVKIFEKKSLGEKGFLFFWYLWGFF